MTREVRHISGSVSREVASIRQTRVGTTQTLDRDSVTSVSQGHELVRSPQRSVGTAHEPVSNGSMIERGRPIADRIGHIMVSLRQTGDRVVHTG